MAGGGPVSEASGREWYSGGICLNRNNPLIVYVSIETISNIFEIYEYITTDGGESWEQVIKYAGKANTKNFRPQYPRNADERYVELMFVSGTYNDLRDYNTSIFSYPATRILLQENGKALLQENGQYLYLGI